MFYKQDIFWNNIPYRKEKVLKNLDFLEQSLIKNSFLRDLKNPYYIWTGTGRIHKLEKLILNSKIQNRLRKKEIYFFLYEPLCLKINDVYNRSFYSEFAANDSLDNVISEELESIKIFVKKNNLSNFKVFTSDYNIHLLKKYSDIKINCLDVFLRDVACSYRTPLNLENNITKKFWCGNWRYTAHRHLVTSYLSNLDGIYTWNLKCSYEELEKNNWFNLEKFKNVDPKRYYQLKNGIDYLYNNVLSIDQIVNAVDVSKFDEVFIPGHGAPRWNQTFLKSYKECFCAIINETRYAQPFGYFSEKTLTAIWTKIPIIIVAPPHTLKYLKTFGFKTFDRWWDESYDQEENHEKRLIKIFNLIDYINSKSIEELKVIYKDMTEVLDHNVEILKTISFNDKIL